ncbi:MBL fold metallo-hydrolase [Dermatobacter hominis]|uniref:MBL fold metallo-hydrolase n=1 Tax=Dermatobacter hominis TaxID=2884263 RepID=UPI001D12B36A|nr:MBL fold metallo-hydrolase [Dermatobacter hominis]UDY34878.1 MBL fold metallo-hydrolase [Dermatobacter hominis]
MGTGPTPGPDHVRPGYVRGLHEVADGVHAYLQPDGGWGWSNAGLITGDGGSLLVDTLFDSNLTREMLDSMRPITGTRPIGTLVNTHANGDHCYGNGLVGDPAASGSAGSVEIIASRATAEEMDDVPPELLGAMVDNDLGDEDLNRYVDAAFGRFDFAGATPAPPTRTFDGSLGLDVAGTAVELIEAGPAHTAGDVIVHVPDAGVVFVGDLGFIGGTPIVWAGPLGNWCDAIDLVAGLGVHTVVPGHGPVCGVAELLEVRDYLCHVEREATERFEGGMSAEEAIADIDLDRWADLGERERIVVNVHTVYRHLDPDAPRPDVLELFRQMAVYGRS